MSESVSTPEPSPEANPTSTMGEVSPEVSESAETAPEAAEATAEDPGQAEASQTSESTDAAESEQPAEAKPKRKRKRKRKPAEKAEQGEKKARMSTAQMLHLMRLEVERALRHQYPISCIVIGLDAFMDEADHVHRKEIMPAIFQKLKQVTFQNDVRGLGIWAEQFQLAVFPHVDPTQLADLADQLVTSASQIESPRWGEQHITVSIGIAHNLHEGEISFDSLVEEAETGMGLAMSAGGNRFIQAHDVETEVDRLKAELEEQIEDIKEHQASYFGDKDGEEENWARGLIQKVIDVFGREQDQNEGVVRLKKEVIALLTTELRTWRETSTVSQLLAGQRQIENLERRVRKLTDSLGVTEKELKRVMAMKSIDVGVASIYRTVQGLNDDDENVGAKKDMLKNIFEANLALQSELKAAKA